MKCPSWASKDLGTIGLCDDKDLEACIEEVMTIKEETSFEGLPLDEPTLELKTLLSTFKYAFLDTQQEKPVIISS